MTGRLLPDINKPLQGNVQLSKPLWKSLAVMEILEQAQNRNQTATMNAMADYIIRDFNGGAE